MARLFDADRLVIASHNPGKVVEIADLMRPFGVACIAAADRQLAEPEETGSDFCGNAILKAEAAARASGLASLADDSGLVVAALDGAPGIFSARWAGPGKDFSVAMQKVETALAGALAGAPAGKDDRRANFACALALAWPDGHVECVEGRVHGRLIFIQTDGDSS